MHDIIIADTHGIRYLGLQEIIQKMYPQARCRQVLEENKLVHSVLWNQPTYVILNTNIIEGSLSTLLNKLQHLKRDIRVLLMVESNERLLPKTLVKCNIQAVILNDASLIEFEEAFNFLFSKSVDTLIPKTTEDKVTKDLLHSLSKSEKVVMQYLISGDRICDIAEFMGLSRSAVSTYKVRAFSKFRVDSLPAFINLLSSSQKLA